MDQAKHSDLNVNRKRKRTKSNEIEEAVPNLDNLPTSDVSVKSKKHKSKKNRKNSETNDVEMVEVNNPPQIDNYEDCDSPESVDSGCVPDKTAESESTNVNWGELRTRLRAEHRYIGDLIVHLPAPVIVNPDTVLAVKKGKNKKGAQGGDDSDSSDDETSGSKGKKKEHNSKDIKRALDYEELRNRWTEKLNSLTQNKPKKNKKTPAMIREEKALRKKLRQLEKRKTIQNKLKIDTSNNTNKTADNQKRIYNKHGKIVFSKFDFGSNQTDKKPEKKKLDLKYALKQAIKKKKEMKTLVKSGKGEEAANAAWEGALSRAQGEKVKDDPELIKQSIRKLESKKKQSKKKWEERNQKMEKQKSDKQKKRQDNIQKRKKDTLNNKIKKMKSRGHIVPGF